MVFQVVAQCSTVGRYWSFGEYAIPVFRVEVWWFRNCFGIIATSQGSDETEQEGVYLPCKVPICTNLFLCLYTSTLKLEIPYSSELSILSHSITRFNNPEDPNFSHNHETSKVCTMVVQFEVFIAKVMKDFVFWGIMMCCLMKTNRQFDRTWCFHPQGGRGSPSSRSKWKPSGKQHEADSKQNSLLAKKMGIMSKLQEISSCPIASRIEVENQYETRKITKVSP
jgi:hypothetical protein